MTILGDFSKFLTRNFTTKVAQAFCDFLSYFEKHPCSVKTVVGTCWVTFEKLGLLFILTSGHTSSAHLFYYDRLVLNR